MTDLMDAQILASRLQKLGWSQYRLAQEYCRVKGLSTDYETVRRYESSVRKALKNPDRSSFEMIQNLILAMDGEHLIRWNHRESVVVEQEEIKIE